MASPAPREPMALAESVRAVLGGLDDDPKLQGKGLSAAFARSFPDPPAEVKSLAATEVARVAVVLGVPGIAVMDVVQLASSAVTRPTTRRPRTRKPGVWHRTGGGCVCRPKLVNHKDSFVEE